MNKRIQELAEQCYEHDQSWTGVGQRIFNKEKFAELIVQECIQEIQNKSMNSSDEWEDGLIIAEYAIKEHFGVDE